MSQNDGLANKRGNPGGDFHPWEQRIGPGMAAGGGSSSSLPEPEFPERLVAGVNREEIQAMIDDQTSLSHYPQVNRFQPGKKDNAENPDSNEKVWSLFTQEKLYDTRRVTLDHFHLFEWFPLSPGKFHTYEGRERRRLALDMMFTASDGHRFFDPSGKASMLNGGVGAVRLRPRLIAGEPYFFMSVSSNGVCHEGFPVLVPRRFYAQVKPRLLDEGAAPVTISGEMRYLYEPLPSFFEGHREIPSLYLHVDELKLLPSPRPEVSKFTVSAAISFTGNVEGKEGIFATYATFDPADPASINKAINWMEQYYVTQLYKGVVITDFDEVIPRFPGAIFNLPDLMAGKLAQGPLQEFLKSQGFSQDAGKNFIVVYKEINTQGGAYIEGDVNTGGGDFIAGNKTVGNN